MISSVIRKQYGIGYKFLAESEKREMKQRRRLFNGDEKREVMTGR